MEEKRKLAMIISYLGERYSGFQMQNNATSIQQILQEALFQLTGEEIVVYASGRTDAGVHAKGQVIHFRTTLPMPLERWCLALNRYLPDDIVALQAYEVPDDFHARRDAVGKIYRYRVDNARFRDVFHLNTSYHYIWPLNEDAMRKAADILIGEHDFTSFCSTRASVRSYVRILHSIDIEREEQFFVFTYHGSGFLYNMVRILTGTLLEVGRGRLTPYDVKRILEAKDRRLAGPTVPPEGLILWKVDYEPSLETHTRLR